MTPLYHRHSTRRVGYDYAAAGTYFVTICCHDPRVHPFGHVVDAAMRLNAGGEIARDCWTAIPDHFPGVNLDTFVVMPNHVHGIIVITGDKAVTASGDTPNDVRARHASPLPAGVQPGSLGAIIGSYKSAVTKGINQMRQTPGARIWQRGYHDKIIENNDMLDQVRQYILDNPGNWETDPDR